MLDNKSTLADVGRVAAGLLEEGAAAPAPYHVYLSRCWALQWSRLPPSAHAQETSERLFEALCRSTRVKMLSIRFCSMGGAASSSAAAMRRSPLDLLGAVLRRNQSITFLDLYYNDINSQAAATLAAALAGHSHSALTQLNLRHNRIGDAGADALAQALVRNTSLTALNLRNNSVSNGAAERLVHTYVQLPAVASHLRRSLRVAAQHAHAPWRGSTRRRRRRSVRRRAGRG